MENKFNFIIIGAGVIGLSIAERLSRRTNNILVIDKEKKFGQHTSSRNSEVVHSGFYYPNKSLKAQLCVKGNKMIYDFCDKYNISYNKCGKLVIANTKYELDQLDKISVLAKSNGVDNIKILSSQQSQEIEPMVKCVKSLWVPSTGIVDSHLLMSKLENLSISRDVSFLYNLEVNSISSGTNGYKLDFKNDEDTVFADNIINCAGLWSHKIANKIVNSKYDIEYYKGDYFKTSQVKNLNCLIYPVPKDLSPSATTIAVPPALPKILTGLQP